MLPKPSVFPSCHSPSTKYSAHLCKWSYRNPGIHFSTRIPSFLSLKASSWLGSFGDIKSVKLGSSQAAFWLMHKQQTGRIFGLLGNIFTVRNRASVFQINLHANLMSYFILCGNSSSFLDYLQVLSWRWLVTIEMRLLWLRINLHDY